MNKPIFLIGFMASGKTKLGKKLANKFKVPFLDLDQKIQEKEEKSISQLFEEFGESGFREIESEFLRQIPLDTPSVISLGGGTPCFNNNIEFINKSGLSVYLKLDPSILIGRLKNDKINRPLVAHLSDKELSNFVKSKLEEREQYYMQAKLILENSDLNEKIIFELFKN